MGILNVTPDSFSDGGQHGDLSSAMDHARRMIADGAALIDIGGESTRPGAEPVSATDEIARTLPVITALRAEWQGLISIDTTKAVVARAALDAGADIVNDISGLRADSAMPGVCAASGCGVVVMHLLGEPMTMQNAPHYGDVVTEVKAYFIERMEALCRAGLDPETLCYDPGIGFGKTLDHNLALLRSLDRIGPPGRPLMLGVSRKSFMRKILGPREPSSLDWTTATVTALARAQGVMLHRVHAVRPNLDAIRMTEALIEIRMSETPSLS